MNSYKPSRNSAYSIFIGSIVLIATLGCAGDVNGPNRGPTLISADEVVFPQTRTGTVYTIIGSDPDGDPLVYSISGLDAASFAVDRTTGRLTFRVAPDVDSPGSVDGDNFYFINVTVTDPSSASDTKQVIIEVSRYDAFGPFLFRDGAAFIGPNTITESDPSTLQSVTFDRTETRVVPNNRFLVDTQTNVHIFQALYQNGTQFEMVVNQEITPFAEAERQARLYARILGQLDPVLIGGIRSVFIHPGDATFTSPSNGIVAHTGRAEKEFIPMGVLEEVMVHEAVHASIDRFYRGTGEWHQVQKSDVVFVSQYARDFAGSEDLTESYGAYLMVKKASRNDATRVQRIRNGIPNRIRFFEERGF